MRPLKDDGAVVVFSGGQDSTTCLYWALERFRTVAAVTFDYGQRHRCEIDAAQQIARLTGVTHTILAIPTFQAVCESSLIGSALVTSPGASQRSSTVPGEIGADGLPDTFVPGRNIIFLSFAAAYAYRVRARHLVTGVCETDFSGYPDCRRSTIDALVQTLALGMEADFVIDTPLMNLSKAASVRLAVELGALPALALSHTCYNGAFPPCGECPACLLRARGFEEAGIPDPLLVRASGGTVG